MGTENNACEAVCSISEFTANEALMTHVYGTEEKVRVSTHCSLSSGRRTMTIFVFLKKF